MTDRTKADISKNMTICCDNCLNDGDSLDWFSSCNMCQSNNGKYYYFLGLKEDKRCKKGYRVIKSVESELEDTEITVEDLLGRIEAEKQMRTEVPMFGGLTLEGIYDR